MDKKMRKKISHLLMPMTFPRLDAEKSFILKNTQKFDLTWVEIAWVELKSNKLKSLEKFRTKFGKWFVLW